MKKMEKGRSMVEMLGVLAIIGVLSVGGIYGYTVAMNKYKANEIVQVASMLATLARSGNAGAGVQNLTAEAAGLADGNVGGEDISAMSASYDEDKETVTVTLPAGIDPKIQASICQIAPTSDNGSGYTIPACNNAGGGA